MDSTPHLFPMLKVNKGRRWRGNECEAVARSSARASVVREGTSSRQAWPLCTRSTVRLLAPAVCRSRWVRADEDEHAVINHRNAVTEPAAPSCLPSSPAPPYSPLPCCPPGFVIDWPWEVVSCVTRTVCSLRVAPNRISLCTGTENIATVTSTESIGSPISLWQILHHLLPPTPIQRTRLLPTIRFRAFDRLPHVPRCHLFVFAWREFLPTGLHEARELEILASHTILKSRLQPANPFLSLFHLSHPLPHQGRCTAHQFVSLSSELHFARTASQPNAWFPLFLFCFCLQIGFFF